MTSIHSFSAPRTRNKARRRGLSGLAVVAAGTSAFALSGVGAHTASAAANDPIVYAFTGSSQTVTVPAGVHSVDLDAIGGGGGAIGNSPGTWLDTSGGWTSRGAEVTGNVRVAPGDKLTVAVGAGGAGGSVGFSCAPAVGGWSKPLRAGAPLDYSGGSGSSTCGAGGGGATVVLLNDEVVAVAAGGGGASDMSHRGQDGGLLAAQAPNVQVSTTNGQSAPAGQWGGGGGGGQRGGASAWNSAPYTAAYAGGSYVMASSVYQPHIRSGASVQTGNGANGSLTLKWQTDALPFTTRSANSSLTAGPWSFNNLNDDVTTSTAASKGWTTDVLTQKTYDWWTYFDVDLGSSRVVHSVVLSPRTAVAGVEDPGVAGAGFPTSFRIEVSPDGNNLTWVKVGHGTASASTTTPVSTDLDYPVSARYVRVVVEEVGHSASDEPNVRRVQLAEFDVY